MFAMNSLLLLCLSGALVFATIHEDPMINLDLYQGDIILSPEQNEQLERGDLKYSALADPKRLWPNAEIPYEVDSSLRINKEASSNLKAAIADYQKYTCLKFVPRTNQRTRYVRFVDGKGCFSPLGYHKDKPNFLSIGKGCWWKATILHEIGHTLGLHHEQTRPDRDDYVFVNRSNIRDSSYKRNFMKEKASEIDSKGTPYDYLSLMHYRASSFQLSGRYPAMITKDPVYQHLIGQKIGLSVIDAHQLNLMYGCSGRFPTPPAIKVVPGCYNSGFDCERIAFKGGCTSGDLKDYAQRSCRMACGKCAGGPSSKDGPYRTYKGNTGPIVTEKPEVCKDTISSCNGVKMHCGKDGSWKELLLKRCRKTCGYCT